MENTKRILVVLAHPDDETFGMGGTLALYARQGALIDLICATRGEVGEVDQEYLAGFNSIGERRENELRCAAGLLGIHDVHFLGYRDSGMPGSEDNHNPQALVQAPIDRVAGEIRQFMWEFQPQVVLTFDPIGGYRHPDHIAIQQATVQAFNQIVNESNPPDGSTPYRPQALYFHTFPRTFLKLITRLMPLVGKDPSRLGRNRDIDLKSIAEVEFPIHVTIDYRPVAEIRERASACHASQGGGIINSGPLGWLRRQISAHDEFMQAYPPPDHGKVKHDLFMGVDLEADSGQAS